MTDDHADRAPALASKISAKAREALHDLMREMAIMEWPAEYRKIMWLAVAEVAAGYAELNAAAAKQWGERI